MVPAHKDNSFCSGIRLFRDDFPPTLSVIVNKYRIYNID